MLQNAFVMAVLVVVGVLMSFGAAATAADPPDPSFSPGSIAVGLTYQSGEYIGYEDEVTLNGDTSDRWKATVTSWDDDVTSIWILGYDFYPDGEGGTIGTPVRLTTDENDQKIFNVWFYQDHGDPTYSVITVWYDRDDDDIFDQDEYSWNTLAVQGWEDWK